MEGVRGAAEVEMLRAVEPITSFAEVFQKSYSALAGAFRECHSCGLELCRTTLLENAFLSGAEILLFMLCAIAWTVLRQAATAFIFQPVCRWCDLNPKDAAKMPESSWKLFFYTVVWSYSTYLLFFAQYPFFFEPASVFYDWKKGMEVPADIAIAYLIQSSFYGHSIYATVYMDTWRKDSLVMLTHHVIAVMLLVSSYAFRYHNVGILVLFLHDFTDVALEFAKLNVYFRNRGGIYHRLNNILASVGCITFGISWFWLRLYLFPLKVLYTTCCIGPQLVPSIPFYFFFNFLLTTVMLMNIYWFLYIVLLVVKVLLGQMREINDVREYEEENIKTMQKTHNNLHHHNSCKDGALFKNGVVKRKHL
ncbi:ceramide synthase 1 [Protopterus annectens]|uniref:ceramide synthase 1 n=1 Tax=Protopterus annectens TaxID=7888 RepID=UPI001CF9EB35|nr:ceramide synthase 1 [Protopterus annectens]